MTAATTDRIPLVPAPLARGTRGAVVAPHHLAAEAGLATLRRGGHAVDAAIATNAALAVVAAHSCGIGGDAFWLGWDARAGDQWALNGSGRSAAAIDADALRARGFDRVPFAGPLSITVPGAVRSWGDAHARFGRLPRSTVLAPAIELAHDGFPASAAWIRSVEAIVPRVLDVAGPDAPFLRLFRPHGRPWRLGERVRLPALGATLERLAAHGFGDFYEGETAERQAATLAACGSPITRDDLSEHASTWTDPIATTYRGVRVTSHPPNSSGIVALELLNILERFDPPRPETWGAHGVTDADWVHVGIEAAKLAMADRNAYLTDPDFASIPVERLLDKAYAAELARRIDRRWASEPPPASVPPGGGTIYLATVDGEGNAISLIESNWSGFGSGIACAETGVHYQNRGSFFSLDPGHANVLAPRKRTMHTLLPGMLFRDGEPGPWIVAGSMGGDVQPQVHAQVVSALVDGQVAVNAAVAAPRWSVEPAAILAPPTDVRLEPRFAPAVREEIERRGHALVPTAAFDSALGHCHAIELVDGGPAREGSVAAATDPRSEGLPAAW